MKLLLYTIVFFTSFVQQVNAQVTLQNLHCEQKVSPLGIDVVQPRFSWQLQSNLRNVQQTSYRIIVSTTQQNLYKFNGDIWDSKVVNSSNAILISYNGKPLESNTKYYWAVIATTNKSKLIIINNAFFTTGLLNNSDWQAKWIGYDKASVWDSITQWSRLSARYLRKEFTTSTTVKRATVFISGLGLYELYINGKKIGNQVLAPNPTDYRKTVFYNTYDVTKNIIVGKNAIGTILGNGRFFTMRQNYKTQKHNTFGYPKLKLQLEIEFANGKKETIITDENWKLNVDGPIRTNNEYDGEEYDATKELGKWSNASYNDTKWLQPEIVIAPDGKLVAQTNAPMQVMQTILAKNIKAIGKEKYIVDMGQNFSGVLKVIASGKLGDTLTLKFAESLQTNGELYTANLRDARVTDKYIFKGTAMPETWQPSFIYHGFRYVEVSGFKGTPTVKNFEGKFIYDNIKTTGSFECSDVTLNKIYANAWRGIASNYKGMPVDCPQRNERQPWLGDRTIGAIGESYMFDNATLYAKWMQDIEDSQKETGSIPDVAPAFWNYYTDDITWPAAFITISNNLYNQFGDVQPIQKHYSAMKKWIVYMQEKYLKEYIMTKDKYGDWCVPPESLALIHAKDSSRITDGTLIATAYYHKLLSYMQRFASLVNQKEDVQLYKLLSDSIAIAFQKKYYNTKLQQYGNNTVTANLLPLYFGIAPDSIKNILATKIRNKIRIDNNSHISTGLIGTQWLMRGLTEIGEVDLAYTIASNKTYPSWGYMVENGATTIWELWNGNTANPQMNSQNHVMLLGDLMIWLYENIAGIRTNKNDVAFKKIIMKPSFPEGLQSAAATYESTHGTIVSRWVNHTSYKQWSVTIPANTTATLYLPTQDVATIFENGVALLNCKEINILKSEKQTTIIEIGSGSYNFSIYPKWRKGIVQNSFIFDRAVFPESHAATIVETPKGLVAAWFGGTKEGNKDVCIWTSHLQKDKWTLPIKVADGVINDSTRYACYNPVLYQVPNGALILFYKIGPNVAGWTGWLKRSFDNGKTWTEREALPKGFLGPIKNKPILVNEKLLCASSTEKTGWKAHVEITNDWGKTWIKTDSINDGKIFSAIQPSILQYKNGALQILCRSQNKTLNQSWSSDNGKTWSAMTATNLPNNNSGTDAVTLQDGRQLLVYNHAIPDSSWIKGKGPRTPLNVAISSDGVKWFTVAILEDSPISQYSYPSVIQSKDGLVHIVYTWRRERVKHIILDLSKIELQEIKNGIWPGQIKSVSKTTEE